MTSECKDGGKLVGKWSVVTLPHAQFVGRRNR
jgi:hypothetical protein